MQQPVSIFDSQSNRICCFQLLESIISTDTFRIIWISQQLSSYRVKAQNFSSYMHCCIVSTLNLRLGGVRAVAASSISHNYSIEPSLSFPLLDAVFPKDPLSDYLEMTRAVFGKRESPTTETAVFFFWMFFPFPFPKDPISDYLMRN